MTSQEILEKYIKFYEERGHKLIPNVSLVPENDPTLLFVNSGMFPLVPYLSGLPHPLGKRLVDVQRALRLEDLDEIGDSIHTLAFHMIGNWSLGDYYKEEQLPWVYEFLVEVLGLDIERMYATVFEGDAYAPRDTESINIIQKIFKKYGVEAKEGERIFAFGRNNNWWQRGDAVGELGGPDSEVFYYLGEGTGLGKNPAEYEDQFLEIGNSVFMQYRKNEKGWEELSQKNVDFGGGLERVAMVVQKKRDIFETDNFYQLITSVEKLTGKKYGEDPFITRSMRIIADHMRASVFLAMDGVIPGNKDQGYVLRRLLRRMIRSGRSLGVEKDLTVSLVGSVVDMFGWLYPQLLALKKEIEHTFAEEENRFRKVLNSGGRETEKRVKILQDKKEINDTTLAQTAFDIFQSYGYPPELFWEDLKDLGVNFEKKVVTKKYEELFTEHQEGSRKGAEQKFKGGLADHSEEVVRYHTATHLLHWALRKVLGEEVHQQGSNITVERLRFDFNYPQKLSEQQIEEVEKLMNEKIAEEVPVSSKILSREEAEKSGALHFFGEKYGDQVTVYYMGPSLGEAFSKEFCGGPHVTNTGELSRIEIYKQEGIGKGKIRIYAKFSGE